MNKICLNCGNHIFEVENAIWSHLEDTNCDDPMFDTRSNYIIAWDTASLDWAIYKLVTDESLPFPFYAFESFKRESESYTQFNQRLGDYNDASI